MKELLRNALMKNYQQSLRDYLSGIGFTKAQADDYVKFAQLSMTKDIKMEQIYEKKIPQALKDFPELAGELLKLQDLQELEVSYRRLSNTSYDFVVVPNKRAEGLYTIIMNG